MKRWRNLCLIFILTLIVASADFLFEGEEMPVSDSYEHYTEGEYWREAKGWFNTELTSLISSESFREVMDTSEKGIATKQYLFQEIHYHKDGIDAVYPHFVSGASVEVMADWNRIIDKDFQKILDIYSFQPYPLPTPEPAAREGAELGLPTPTAAPEKADITFLSITYEIKSADDHNFSLFYLAAFHPEFVAHPTQLAYTTNINLTASKRLSLSDIIRINNAFVEDFRSWDIITTEPVNEEFNQAVRAYVESLSDRELLIGFQTADIIGTGNYLGIYSYLPPGRLGISLSVPNYLGDHVEFEKNINELKSYLLPASQTVEHIIQQ